MPFARRVLDLDAPALRLERVRRDAELRRDLGQQLLQRVLGGTRTVGETEPTVMLPPLPGANG